MEKELIISKKVEITETLAESVNVFSQFKSTTPISQNDSPKMGTGRCMICDCQGFFPSSGGRTCINHNSAGGTCNHYKNEHY